MPHRDLMAPDTEPTDEELDAVMRAALALAIQRRAIGEVWIAARRIRHDRPGFRPLPALLPLPISASRGNESGNSG